MTKKGGKGQKLAKGQAKMTQGTYYYEFYEGTFYLALPEGEFQEFTTRDAMFQYIDDPSALFIEVTDDNWHELYEQGVFHQ